MATAAAALAIGECETDPWVVGVVVLGLAGAGKRGIHRDRAIALALSSDNNQSQIKTHHDGTKISFLMSVETQFGDSVHWPKQSMCIVEKLD